ncbi:spermidine/putrescine transport system permease protein [Hathewaya proteolytica DSM 3090]|uniref:Spermidine/putrescine transport system permease protein n=1 Tax=Hathewaya proteolytica DSM 3090 TaxID=1121331 RepID=A0A1M6J291_9CLOT|nr:ABC transporter permease [Hathewaya proteolytica]SHJ40806.1 spermidine/putrescine transport system permease protein [Hathewaya proteolytica DSM 3090]
MKKFTSFPYLIWLFLFIVFPIGAILYYSFTIDISNPTFTLEHYKRFLSPIYMEIMYNSLLLALKATFICFLLGYPMAYIICGLKEKHKNTLLILLMLPMWMNFLLRTYAWISLLGKNGPISAILSLFGFNNVRLLYTETAVLIGMVYNYLPFMILPIFTSLNNMDKSLIEAAYDLGATKIKAFLLVIFPMSIKGVISGITMVFMPCVTTFVISKLLGGGKYMLIGNLIEQQYLTLYDWNFGSAISIAIILMIVLIIALVPKNDKSKGGGVLW